MTSGFAGKFKIITTLSQDTGTEQNKVFFPFNPLISEIVGLFVISANFSAFRGRSRMGILIFD